MPVAVERDRHLVPLSALDSIRDQITLLDTHNHTNHSPDGKSHWRAMLSAGKAVGLDAMVISDHDTMSKQNKMHQFAQELELIHFFGVELTTRYKRAFPHIVLIDRERDVIRSFLKHIKLNIGEVPLPLYLSGPLYAATVYPVAPPVQLVMEWLQDHPQVFSVIAHPQKGPRSSQSTLDSKMLTSLSLDEIEKFVGGFEAMEIMNSHSNPSLDHERLAFAMANGLIPVAGSDAHHESKVGRVMTWVEGKYTSKKKLLEALRSKPVGTTFNDQKK